ETSPADTRAAAAAMAAAPVDLLLFAGGDGTAVDVLETVGEHVPILGVPAGVKMHSAVFAVNPRSAGRIARAVAEGSVRELADAEVMDVDEEALRRGRVSPRLHGYAKVPLERTLVQSAKARSAPGERAAQERLARHVAAELLTEGLWLVGPGSTTRAVLAALGLEKTLLGVDAVESGRLVAVDADESALRELAAAGGARILVTPIGGQGFLLGRGNQQLSAEVVRAVGPDRIAVVATEAKLAALGGRPLLVDTGDRELDARLAGHVRVIAGPGREIVYRVSG
ncbi:MAG TPA: NAD(+)/NADH kinase, partial [Planctomycetota bacterium]|nr:NAD(+)/NADH kinase [Planctomycetota bacterium]